MLKHPTLDQLRAMKLDGMADAFTELAAQDNARDLGHAEWLALLIDREMADRGTKGPSLRKPPEKSGGRGGLDTNGEE